MTKSTSPKTPNNSELEKKIAAVCGLLLPKEIDQILALIHTETQRAVEEELEFAYKMATPEQKKALRELYESRGVNKGLSWAVNHKEKKS